MWFLSNKVKMYDRWSRWSEIKWRPVMRSYYAGYSKRWWFRDDGGLNGTHSGKVGPFPSYMGGCRGDIMYNGYNVSDVCIKFSEQRLFPTVFFEQKKRLSSSWFCLEDLIEPFQSKPIRIFKLSIIQFWAGSSFFTESSFWTRVIWNGPYGRAWKRPEVA